MKAIYTKVLPATETKPRKVKAFDLDGNSITYDEIDLGVDVETVSDVDMFTAGKPVNTEKQLIKAIES